MSANNRRVRRMVVDILFDEGPLTRTEISDILAKRRGLREVPSDNRLSSILSKNVQGVSVGSAVVEKSNGIRTKHMVFDVDRDVIHNKTDLTYTRPLSSMTERERRKALRCEMCGRKRIFPPGGAMCLPCLRQRGF